MATPPVRQLLSLLGDMRSMIERIDDDSYAAPAPGRRSGGIGSHVRHCLDHVGALMVATRTGICTYDRRARGTDIEARRIAALNQIACFEDELGRLDETWLGAPIDVETQLDTDGSMLVTISTVGRELVFVTSHTIHHNAIIGHLLATRGVAMGPRFGVAPATPVETVLTACAR